MRNKGLHLYNNVLVFNKWCIGDIPLNCITPSFRIQIEDIKAIVISPRFAFDDEVLIITLIDKEKKFRQFSSSEFKKKSVKELEDRLGLNSIQHIEWEKFSEEELDDGITDKIIYPKELYGENLFIKPKGFHKIVIQALKFFYFKKSVSGKLNPIIEAYFKNYD